MTSRSFTASAQSAETQNVPSNVIAFTALEILQLTCLQELVEKATAENRRESAIKPKRDTPKRAGPARLTPTQSRPEIQFCERRHLEEQKYQGVA